MSNKNNKEFKKNTATSEEPITGMKESNIIIDDINPASSETTEETIIGVDLCCETSEMTEDGEAAVGVDVSDVCLSDEEKYENKIPIEGAVVYGKVTPSRLNVRQFPKPDSSVICIINAGDEVVLELDSSTDDFYKVCTESGIYGYCMKRFIEVIK